MTEKLRTTPGPWEWHGNQLVAPAVHSTLLRDVTFWNQDPGDKGLLAAAPDFLEAAQLLEAAELGRDDCEECEGDDVPEKCGTCFPKFDDARIKRRIAIAKATLPTAERQG